VLNRLLFCAETGIRAESFSDQLNPAFVLMMTDQPLRTPFNLEKAVNPR